MTAQKVDGPGIMERPDSHGVPGIPRVHPAGYLQHR
jgi:hypothetical protein